MYEAIDHAGTNATFDEQLNLLLSGDSSLGLQYEVTRTDGDGDVMQGSAQITLASANGSVFGFDDDGPTMGSAPSAVLANADNGYATGSSIVDLGSDGEGYSDLTGNITGWNGSTTTFEASTLTSSGATVYYYVDPDNLGVLYAYTSTSAAGYTGGAGQSLVFTLTLNAAGGYTLDMDGKLDAPTQIYSATFGNIPGGQQDYLVVTNTGAIYKPGQVIPDGQSVVVSIDSSATTVNSSNVGLAAGNQWVSGAETLYFDFSEPAVNVSFAIDIQSGGETNSVGWTVYGTNANGELVAEMGSTNFSDGVLTQISTTLTNITRVELSDSAGPEGFRVQKISVVDRIDESPVSTSFQLAVVDGDGDRASTNLNVTFEPQVAATFIVGSNANDVSGSPAPYIVPGGAGVIKGKAGSDVLVGDEGRASVIGKSVNLILMLDSSGSMSTSIQFGNTIMPRMEALALSVNTLLATLAVGAATNVRVNLIDFGDSATSLGVFDLRVNNVKSDVGLGAAQNAVNSMTAGGWTNYEAALQAALNWAGGTGTIDPYSGSNVINQAIFVSDGEPNSWLNGNSTSLNSTVLNGGSTTAVGQMLGSSNPPGQNNTDSINEVAQLESVFGQIEAVGIAVGGTALDILNQVEGMAGNVNPDVATNVTSGDQLQDVLLNFNPETVLADAGNDLIEGGDGDDLIFGDVLFTDVLGAAAGLSTQAGAGWGVFAALESGQGVGPAYAGWDRADTLAYIKANALQLAGESGREQGLDTLLGAGGNDLIFGQEGDDVLIGGLGDDVLSGGSGADTFRWLSTDTTGADTILDFNPGEGDKLDLTQLLVGESYNSGSLDDFLSFSVVDNSTIIAVSPTAGGAATTTIELTGFNVAIEYGVTPDGGGIISGGADTASVINGLLGDNALQLV
ncbi:type I secretion C-terminal target domain-containing protein [Pseudomonas sp. MIL19]|uniref:beta strand repeat-containing protein n=1 Tax=Pseudomonas sp. MIL19 TaxID=2976979 RepID=UPI0023633856|nr:type I secretion C-terminal target domain-containing protein [Pseudomonas sp. MIL19]MDD2159550.1 type I secretion C-terminal target domain-containing protein [Pseudomonas sp. MIL19]